MSVDQPRLPAGLPGGGQFAARIVPESHSVVLPEIISDDEHNADGTYEYPPSPRSARQVIAFWTRCQIPDRVLKQVEFAHNRLVSYYAAQADTIGRKVISSKAEREGARLIVPPAIPRADIRTVVRLAKMHWDAQALPEEERVKVDECVFTLDQGSRVTAPYIVDYYRLGEIYEAFDDNQERTLYETQVEIRNQLAGTFDGQRSI